MLEDPVCGMQLMPEDAVAESEYGGETFFFCSDECKDEFDREPERYVTPARQTTF